MALNIPGLPSIFPTSKRTSSGGGKIRAGQATIVVAQDGSGDTDDIQSGINMLPSSGGQVFVKDGIYTITTAISIGDNNITLTGAGIGTQIKTATAINLIEITSKTDITIESLYFVGIGSDNSLNKAIKITTCTNIIIRKCKFFDMGDTDIYALNSNQIFALDNYFDDGYEYAIQIDGTAKHIVSGNYIKGSTNRIGGIFIDDSNYCIVSDNMIDGLNGFGILIMDGYNAEIVGNLVTGCDDVGIQLSGYEEAVVTGNTFESCTKHGIHIDISNRNTITGNVCTYNDSGNTTTYSGIFLNTSDNNIICGNKCNDNDNYGINISNNLCDKNIIIGNQCIGNTTGAINDAGTNTHPNGASGTTNLALDDLNIIA